jgi:hypothetical protein
MLAAAIVLFLLAAAGGAVMAADIFKGRSPANVIVVLHGLLAATGLGLLTWMWLRGAATSTLPLGLGVLVVAALGGFFLLSFPLRGKPSPRAVVVIHALAAVGGVGVLAYSLL